MAPSFFEGMPTVHRHGRDGLHVGRDGLMGVAMVLFRGQSSMRLMNTQGWGSWLKKCFSFWFQSSRVLRHKQDARCLRYFCHCHDQISDHSSLREGGFPFGLWFKGIFLSCRGRHGSCQGRHGGRNRRTAGHFSFLKLHLGSRV